MTLAVDRLVEAAAAQSGVEPSDADPSWRPGLDVLADALVEEARLSPVGAVALEVQVTTQLANRFGVDAWCAAHDLADTPIEAPVFVVGLPRTGTTLLSYLLGRDERWRSLMAWEAHRSVPPPRGDQFATDPRVAHQRDEYDALYATNPEFAAIHWEDPDGPTEDVQLLAQDFRSFQWETLANIPSYSAWLLAEDLAPTYRYHRRALSVLQSAAPGRWCLKSPQHALALDALVDRYPDARFVQTWRDPAIVVASICSLIRSLTGTFSDHVDDRYVAEHWPEVLLECVRRLADFRRRRPDITVVDVRYEDLVADPIATIDDVYAALGDDLGAEARRAMEAYAGANPKDRRGRHDYDLSEFGLDAAEVRARFAPYIPRTDR